MPRRHALPGWVGRLQVQLCCLALVIALPVMIFQGYELRADAEAADAAARRELNRSVQTAVRAQADAVDDIRLTLEILSKVPDVTSGSAEACEQVMRDTAEMRSSIVGLYAVALNGHVDCSSAASTRGISIADRPYFQQALSSGELTVSGFLIGRVSKKPSIAAALPVFDRNGRPIKMLVATIDLKSVEDAARQIANRIPGSIIAIIDKEGTLLARYPSGTITPGLNFRHHPMFATIAASSDGIAMVNTLDGVARLIGFRDIPGTSAKLVVGFSQAQIMADVEKRMWRHGLTTALLLGGLMLTILGGGYVLFMRPLHQISSLARSIGSGEKLPRTLPRFLSTEFGNMLRDLAIMSGQIRRRERALVQARDKLNVLAFSDGLTQIANRRRFDDLLAQMAQDMELAGSQISVVLADIDHFKRFNDRYGHGRGDSALVCVAHALERHALAADVHACRIGGEEFAILLPGDDLAAAAQLAEAIRADIEAEGLPHADGLGKVLTLSVGVANVAIGGQDWATRLMAEADAALYAAKAAGRNQVKTQLGRENSCQLVESRRQVA